MTPETSQQEPAIKTSFEALTDVLKAETETYQQVSKLMAEKSHVLVSGTYQQLPLLDQQLLGLGQKSLQLEQERVTVMNGIAEPETTLRQLINGMPVNKDREHLEEARRQLLKVSEDIRTLNQDHRRLLRQSSKWVSDTLKAVNTAVNPDPSSYKADAGRRVSTNSNLTKAIQSTVIRDA